MKKTILLFVSIFMVVTMKAQTITVDGNMDDWAEVPVLSEPGVFPYVKMHVANDFIFYNAGLESGTAGFSNDSWYLVDIYFDTDNNATTGYKQWVYAASGMDYLQEGPEFRNHTGTDGGWGWNVLANTTRNCSADGNKMEGSIDKTLFTHATLGDVFHAAPRYYINNAGGELYFQPIDWNFGDGIRKGYAIKPRTIVSEDAQNKIELTSSNAYFMPFMKDTNIDDYLDFESGESSTDNPKHWASWAIDLKNPSTFSVSMTHQGGSGKVVFYLIDMASNAVVFETTTDIWYAEHTTFTEHAALTTLDFSAIPAGKYMLKIKNPTDWSVNLKVQKLVLTNTNPTPPTSQTLVNQNNVRVWNELGELMINSDEIRDITIYSLTGASVFSAESVRTARVALEAGAYIVKTTLGKETSIHKVIVK